MKSFAGLMAAMEENSGGRGYWNIEQNPEALKKSLALLNEKHAFAPGDIVEWKPGMKNRKIIGPFIVVEVLEHPVLNSQEEGTPLFREPLDIIIGRHDGDGVFDCFHLDSRRLQPYSGE